MSFMCSQSCKQTKASTVFGFSELWQGVITLFPNTECRLRQLKRHGWWGDLEPYLQVLDNSQMRPSKIPICPNQFLGLLKVLPDTDPTEISDFVVQQWSSNQHNHQTSHLSIMLNIITRIGYRWARIQDLVLIKWLIKLGYNFINLFFSSRLINMYHREEAIHWIILFASVTSNQHQ